MKEYMFSLIFYQNQITKNVTFVDVYLLKTIFSLVTF